MKVQQILPQARARLAVIDVASDITEAARLMLKPHTNLLVVCDGGVMAGVVTKTDIVAQISQHSSGAARVDSIMTRDVASCTVADLLRDVWQMMQERSFQRIPIVDSAQRPIGVIYSRDALQCLLGEVEIDDELLRAYIAGVGYR
jgi:predicted transcriptional regulator